MNHKNARGFTLLELMVGLVVLAILTVVGGVSYFRYIQKAKINEAINFLANIKIQQETYNSLYGQFVDTSASPASHGDSDFYPGTITGGDKPWEIRCPEDQATYPGWCALGVHPGADNVDFQYVTVGWAPGDPEPPSYYIREPNRRWWYAVARGDLDSNGVYSTFILSSEIKDVVLINELQ